MNAPVLTKDTKDEYLTYIDHIVKAQLTDIGKESELYELVRTYQIHSHSESCRKYKNIDCRYPFGRGFTDRIIIADPLPDDMSGDEKESILQKHNAILNVVNEYIDTYLDPRKVNILYPLKSDYLKAKDINSILLEISFTTEVYYDALKISTDNGF